MTRFEIEWQKMLDGEAYDASMPEFFKMLSATRKALKLYNDLDPDNATRLDEILYSLLGSRGTRCIINQPFRCDYGRNIRVGRNFFANFNLTILDEAQVTIGDNAFIGPNVSIFTACHPLEAELRNKNVQWAKPVTIGNNVWIGGDTTILPGVTVGHNVVIGAGSVVTKDIPDNVVCAGNPARIIRYLPSDSSIDGCSRTPDDPASAHTQLGLDSCGD